MHLFGVEIMKHANILVDFHRGESSWSINWWQCMLNCW